jgi:hypothetical protein
MVQWEEFVVLLLEEKRGRIITRGKCVERKELCYVVGWKHPHSWEV